jgi:NTP pyrophosphatase (non-canonical NTP hydrolase)
VGELHRALRRGKAEELAGEFADVLAWLATLASLSGIDLEEAARRSTPPAARAAPPAPCACA